MSDSINRQDVIGIVEFECGKWRGLAKTIVEEIEQLPSVELERKKGEWIEDDDSTVRGHCSECGWESHYYEDDVIGMPFCPNCGAKMISESECWAEVGKSFAEGLYKGLTERD